MESKKNVDKNKKINETEKKPPKGTRDYDAQLETKRENIVKICKDTFALYGAQPMQTPIFEIKSLMMDKYNDNDTEKQVYDVGEENMLSQLKDIIRNGSSVDAGVVVGSGSSDLNNNDKLAQIGELINQNKSEQYVLRYDLTVPFARFVKTTELKKITRYQIGTVYRKDQPNMAQGRFREFMQCDFDILGDTVDEIAGNSEVLDVLITLLSNLKVPKYTIKINSRTILDDLFMACDISKDLFKTICSSIDKLDKNDWSYVEKEIIAKGLTVEKTKKLRDLITSCKSNRELKSVMKIEFLSEKSRKEITDLVDNLDSRFIGNSWDKNVEFDISLARGLDYYTSLIFEVVVPKEKGKQQIGSIAGGGRYDNLCGVKCVGFSIGIDRLLTVLDDKNREPIHTVWVVQVGENLSPEFEEKLFARRQQIVRRFREFGIKAGTELRASTGPGNQMKWALKQEIPFVVFIGEKEYNSPVIQLSLKDMQTHKQLNMLSFLEVLKIINKQ